MKFSPLLLWERFAQITGKLHLGNNGNEPDHTQSAVKGPKLTNCKQKYHSPL